ncbi:MAG: hypothetical protein Q8N45_11825, partial [Anaerolineales bacterium]|nr:hypothetical protein [Anaerolineales bacterium]
MKTGQSETFPLTSLRLRFHCAAESHIQFGGLRAGSNLRGALIGVMRRATCAEAPLLAGEGEGVRSAHLAICPVCWLVAANDHPGQERRGHVITAPSQPPPSEEHGWGRGGGMFPSEEHGQGRGDCVEPGEAFGEIRAGGPEGRYGITANPREPISCSIHIPTCRVGLRQGYNLRT